MNVQQAYNAWSESYDSSVNKTRDLEALALREIVIAENQPDILELGCGTGKNTEYLATKAKNLVGADFSAEMLARARAKISARNVEFRIIDLRRVWNFPENSFDLITCSLVLEHLENIDFIFAQASRVLRREGRFYLGELHPFRQYQGSKAKFDTGSGVFELECFVHQVSEFFNAAKNNGFDCIDLKEWFDDIAKAEVPRLLTMFFQAKN